MYTQDRGSRPFSVTRATDVPVGESEALQPEVPISPGSGPREVLVTRELHRHAGEPGAQCAARVRVAGRTGRQQGAGDVMYAKGDHRHTDLSQALPSVAGTQ